MENVQRRRIDGIRVLVVDDHAANRELARIFLVGVGAEITEATDGQEAVDLAEEAPFDVILMDLRMPGMDGRTALAKIRASQGPNDATPILAFTADLTEETAVDLRLQGFDGAVAKPVAAKDLIAAIARATDFSDLPEGAADVAA